MPGRLGQGLDPVWLRRLEDACVQAVAEARAARRPARLSFGLGTDPGVARNRRHPGGPVDPAVLTSKVTLAGAHSSGFSSIAGDSVLGIPIPVVVCVVIVVALEWMLIKTPFGRAVYATGMSPRAAQLAGMPVTNRRRRPYASASLPPISISAANVSA